MGSMLQDVEPQLIEFEYLGVDESSVTAYDWAVKPKQQDCDCDCGSWKAHWLSYANKPWPAQCCVQGCNHTPVLAVQVGNLDVRGTRLAPMCESCRDIDGKFDLKEGVSLPSTADRDNCGRVTA